MWRADNDVQQMLRKSAEEFLAAEGGPPHLRACRELEFGFDANAWAQMGTLGWTGMLLPESVGGSELGLEPALTLAEELGGALAPEPFVSSAVMAATLLSKSDAASAKALAAKLAAGAAVVTVAWQERANQIGAGTASTRLQKGKLSGRKLYVPAWNKGAMLLVNAMGPREPVVVLVDSEAAGLRARIDRMTDASASASVEFEDVAVGADAVVLEGRAAHEAVDLALARGTLALCAQLDGLAASLWRRTAEYLKQRVQFEQPLADFQVIRHRMVDLYAGIELAAASWRAAIPAVESGAVSVALHAAKARCSDVAVDMGRWSLQYHGALGYTEDADVGLYLNTALRWSSWLGNAAAHRRQALTAHQNAERA